MKKRLVIALFLIILLTTIDSKQSFVISKFNLKTIIIENNLLLKDKDIKSLLIPFYNRNLISLDNKEVKKALLQNSFIESFNIKKKYPNSLKIEIFEKKPIAILLNKKNKFYLSEKIELIEFKNLPNYQNLPYVLGNKSDFKIFYDNLKKINFPLDLVNKETKNNRVLKLPADNYIKSLENFLNIKSKDDFKKFELFDYRINNQLILK